MNYGICHEEEEGKWKIHHVGGYGVLEGFCMGVEYMLREGDIDLLEGQVCVESDKLVGAFFSGSTVDLKDMQGVVTMQEVMEKGARSVLRGYYRKKIESHKKN